MSRRAAIILALAILAADQATKLWVLAAHNAGELPTRVAPFLDIVLVWNRGISYGLFQQDSDLGRWALVAFTVVATLALSVWLWRASHGLVRLGLALIVGGAIGNLIDRVAYGAVVDFVHLFWGNFSWYVFNIADTTIVLGVIALLWDGFFPSREAKS